MFAIGIHNLPEGLATFTATLKEPAMGLPLAVGIALHNIPEGVCVRACTALCPALLLFCTGAGGRRGVGPPPRLVSTSSGRLRPDTHVGLSGLHSRVIMGPAKEVVFGMFCCF